MDINIITALIGIFSGAVGYWFSTFSVQPILRFRQVRARVHSEFIFYAQVIKSDNLNDEMRQLHRERIRSNRKSSADLSAAYVELPGWYRRYLNWRGRRPEDAVRHLIGYSNTFDYDDAHKLEEKVKNALDLPIEI